MKPAVVWSPGIAGRRRGLSMILAGVVAVAVGVAGCGGGSPSSSASSAPSEVAKQPAVAILAASVAAAKAASTVHITGSVAVGGRPVDVTADLVAGQGGRIAYAVDGGRVSLLRVGRVAWVKFTGLFRREHATNPALLVPALLAQGRWLKVPIRSFADLLVVTDATRLFDSLNATDRPLSKAAATGADGQPVVRLTTPHGSTLDVATTGKPYPVSAISAPGAAGLSLTFSLWNRTFHARPPYNPVTPAQARAFAKRFVKRREAGAAKSITNVAVTPSAISATTERFRAPGMALEFHYPSAFRPVTLPDVRIAGQSLGSATRAAVGIGPYDLLVVDRFAGRAVPVTRGNVAGLAPGFDSLISGGAGHQVTDRIGTAGGLVAIFFAPFANPAVPGVREIILNVFSGDDEYELRCQSSAAHRAEVNRACSEMIATLGGIEQRPQPDLSGPALPVR